jgi:hypothetical protein
VEAPVIAEIAAIPEEDLPNTKALFYRPEDYESNSIKTRMKVN